MNVKEYYDYSIYDYYNKYYDNISIVYDNDFIITYEREPRIKKIKTIIKSALSQLLP